MSGKSTAGRDIVPSHAKNLPVVAAGVQCGPRSCLSRARILKIAREEPVLLLTEQGEGFVISETDDFEEEVARLRASPSFLRFLDERSKQQLTIPLDHMEREIDDELAR